MRTKENRRLLKVGLTGGIGGGKSVVAAVFKKFGAIVLSADEIGRELTETSPRIKKEIRKEFGPEVFDEMGSVDRKRLAKIVFSSKKKKEKLNAIIHPYVLEKIEEETSRLEKNLGVRYVIHEAALIFEAGVNKNLDYVVVIDADEEKRIQRVMERDGVSRADVVRRINFQMPAKKKRELADFVIENDSNLQSLEAKVRFLHNLFLKISESSSAANS